MWATAPPIGPGRVNYCGCTMTRTICAAMILMLGVGSSIAADAKQGDDAKAQKVTIKNLKYDPPRCNEPARSPPGSLLPRGNSGRAPIVRCDGIDKALPERQGFLFGFLFGKSTVSVLMSTTRRIEIYDTTLRDGTQGEGFNL